MKHVVLYLFVYSIVQCSRDMSDLQWLAVHNYVQCAGDK